MTLVWLKSPGSIPDLPQKRLIADAYAALQPDDRTLAIYLEKIRTLEQRGQLTKEDVYALVYNNKIKEIIIDAVLSNKDIEDEQTILDIREKYKSKITKSEKEALIRERNQREQLEKKD